MAHNGHLQPHTAAQQPPPPSYDAPYIPSQPQAQAQAQPQAQPQLVVPSGTPVGKPGNAVGNPYTAAAAGAGGPMPGQPAYVKNSVTRLTSKQQRQQNGCHYTPWICWWYDAELSCIACFLLIAGIVLLSIALALHLRMQTLPTGPVRQGYEYAAGNWTQSARAAFAAVAPGWSPNVAGPGGPPASFDARSTNLPSDQIDADAIAEAVYTPLIYEGLAVGNETILLLSRFSLPSAPSGNTTANATTPASPPPPPYDASVYQLNWQVTLDPAVGGGTVSFPVSLLRQASLTRAEVSSSCSFRESFCDTACARLGGTWLASNQTCFVFEAADALCGVIRSTSSGWEAAGPCDSNPPTSSPFAASVASYSSATPNTTLDTTTIVTTLRSYDDPYMYLTRATRGTFRLDPKGRTRRRPNSGITPCFIVGIVLTSIAVLLYSMLCLEAVTSDEPNRKGHGGGGDCDCNCNC